MKLDQLGADVIRQAVRVFVEVAWGAEQFDERWPADALAGDSTEEILARFDDETERQGASGMRRFTLRIGNAHYPHMKFVVQEVLLEGEFFMSVDSHDDAETDPSYPGYAEWCALRTENLRIKESIEDRWRRQFDIQTCAELVGQRHPAAEACDGRRILVVDDEREIAQAVAAMLVAEGYQVRVAYDGEEALTAVAEFDPELMIVDYQMPGIDGVEVCRRLRQIEATRELPILLSTASMMDLSVFGRLASGFLLKPYHRDWLLGFVTRHLP